MLMVDADYLGLWGVIQQKLINYKKGVEYGWNKYDKKVVSRFRRRFRLLGFRFAISFLQRSMSALPCSIVH